jgi:hypothetical protein
MDGQVADRVSQEQAIKYSSTVVGWLNGIFCDSWLFDFFVWMAVMGIATKVDLWFSWFEQCVLRASARFDGFEFMKYSITAKVVNVKETTRVVLGRATGLASIFMIEKYLKRLQRISKLFLKAKMEWTKLTEQQNKTK